MRSKTTIEHEIRAIDEYGDCIDCLYSFTGKGSHMKAKGAFNNLEPDEHAKAYIIERVHTTGNDADGVTHRKYEYVAHKGCRHSLREGGWITKRQF